VTKLDLNMARPRTPLGEMSPHVLRLLLEALIPMKMSCRRGDVFFVAHMGRQHLADCFLFLFYTTRAAESFHFGLYIKINSLSVHTLMEKVFP